MGKCKTKVKEVRFVIEDELTQVYVLVEALGDCPLGVQGWHHKTFPKSMSILDIMHDKVFLEHVNWAQDSPN